MTIRSKIFILTGLLLALFGAVVGVLAIMQQRTADNLEDIVEHDLPVTRVFADVDVLSYEYELLFERMRRRDNWSDEGLSAAVAQAAALGQRLKADFGEINKRLGEAIDHNLGDPHDLLRLARVQGAMSFLERQVDPFIAIGERVGAALIDGRRDDAVAAAREFQNFEEAFGPDLANIRAELVKMTDRAASNIYDSQRLNSMLAFGLFLLASGVGIGISGFGSGQVVSTLRQLLVSTRALESGKLDISVPIVTKDEVGELAASFNRMLVELRERERFKTAFGTFVDPRIVQRLLAASDDENQAERRVVTVFFSDIKGFTAASEQLTAGTMVKLLNHYFTAAAEVIHRHNGIIDKYIGDSVMAFWTSPFSAGDSHAADACLAALAQQEAIAKLRAELPEITGLRRNAPELTVRMGMATGDAVTAVVGSPSARSYTVIGDTVNLASRLEGTNKAYGTAMLVSEDTYRLAQHVVEAREIDLVTVVGKTEPIRIYELLGRTGTLSPSQAMMRDAFAAGLAAYRRRDWDDAEAEFGRVLELVPGDGPASLFLDRIRTLRASPPTQDWDGAWRLASK